MNAMTKKSWRDLSIHKGRTLLVVLSIAVGVFGLSTIVGISDLVVKALQDSYRAAQVAHIILNIELAPGEVVDHLQTLPGVRDVEGRIVFSSRWNINDRWEPVQVVGLTDVAGPKMNRFIKTEGDYPSSTSLLVDRSALDILTLAIGQQVTVEGRDGGIPLTISGFVRDPTHGSASLSGQATVYVVQDLAERLLGERGVNTILVRLGDFDQAEEMGKVIQRRLHEQRVSILGFAIRNPEEHPGRQSLDMLLAIMGALGAVSLFLSSFLVLNTVSAVLVEQVPQIGSMKAIGGTKGQIVRIYLTSVLFYGVVAVLLALPAGSLVSYAMANYIAAMGNVELVSFTASPLAIGLGLFVGLAIPVGAALGPVLSGARITIREAIGSHGISAHFGHNWLEHLLERAGFMPRSVLLSLRNTFRRKGRALLTLAALSVAGIAFLAVLSTNASLTHTLDTLLNTYDLDVQVEFPLPVDSVQVVTIAGQLPGVELVEDWLWLPATLDGAKVSVASVPPGSTVYNKRLVTGRWLEAGDGQVLVVAQPLAEDRDWTVGERVTLGVGGVEEGWEIVGIVRDYNGTGNTVLTPQGSVEAMLGLSGRTNTLFLKTRQRGEKYVQEIADQARNAFSEAGFQASLLTSHQVRRQITQTFQILIAFLMAMVVLVAVVGGLGLFGNLTINVLERRREIGVMRSIGADSRSIVQIFIVEGIVLAIISWLVACMLSYPVAGWFTSLFRESFAPLDFSFPVSGVVLWLAVVLALAVVSSVGPALQALRMKIREIILYE